MSGTLPTFIRQLRITESLIARTRGLFEPFRGSQIEGCVLWYGHAFENGICEVRAAISPPQIGRRQNYAITADGMRAVREKTRPEGYLLLTQIHTHPRLAFFSEWDAANALNKRQGALNMVVPNYGNAPWIDTAQFCMVEMDSRGNWNPWAGSDWSRVAIIGASAAAGVVA